MSQEKQYLDLIKRILQHGDKRLCRNGYTYSIFGEHMRFDLRNNSIPILTTKRTAWKTCLKELLWFIRGETDNKILKNKNVKIWNGNGSREFLDSVGLNENREDDLGPIYGFQWRNFNGDYKSCDDFKKNGIDQFRNIVHKLMNGDKYSRRLIISAWNPCDINKMALPPCHVLFQFYVNSKDELSCHLYQRSGDVGLGVPFNIASYSFLTHIVANACGLKAGEFVYSLGDCHIYEEHIDALKEQIEREPYEFPTITFNKNLTTYNVDDAIEIMENLKTDDITINDYNYHAKIKMDMKA